VHLSSACLEALHLLGGTNEMKNRNTRKKMKGKKKKIQGILLECGRETDGLDDTGDENHIDKQTSRARKQTGYAEGAKPKGLKPAM
jgi:hypothetical protein